MSLRGKIRRRLLVLMSVALIGGTIVGSIAAVRLTYLRRTALRARSDGLEAMAQGDFPSAMKELGQYLSRHPNDIDVLLPYAKARQNVEEPNNSNLGQAIALYQRILDLHPGIVEAQRNLLDLYIEVGYNTEAISLADRILSDPPDNSADISHALRCKVSALMRLQRLDEAQITLKQLTKISPLDIEVRILELQLMLKRGTPEQVTEYANQLALDHPNDARFDLLRSVAASLTGDRKSAVILVRPLVTRPQVDADYTRLLIRQLDNVELFDESFSVVKREAEKSSDTEMKHIWVRRLFETSQFQRLIEQTAGLDPAARGADVEVLAMRALALSQLDRSSDANDIVRALEKRGNTDLLAAKWAAVLRVAALHESSDPVNTVSVLRNALISIPGHAILLQELGDAYAEAGSKDKAMSAWRTVAHIAPEWAKPFMRISQVLVTAGRPADALEAAQSAQLRAPHDYDVLVSLAAASAASLPNAPSPEAAKVLAMIADIEKLNPKESSNLLPLRVHVLAQDRQRDAALDVLRTTLASDPLPPERVLLSLAHISQAFGLDQEEACWTASEKAYGLTPDLAFNRACWLNDHQKGSDGLALLEKAYAAHPKDDISWRRVWAEYLDITGDPRAKDEWIALGDGNPQNLKLQWGVISARSIQTDHNFVGRTIDRLTSLIGEDTVALRLLRARWLLQDQSSESDVTQAAVILGEIYRGAPDMVAPRLLLADCYMRLGNTTGAIDQLAAASDAQPELASLSLEVARLLQAQGDFSRSRQYIERACGNNHVAIQVVDQAAGLLALQGDYPAALSLLSKAHANEKALPPDLMLAALYRQLDQPAKTSEICRRLLEKPDAQSVAFAADFYASQGRFGDAKSALSLLDGLHLPPGSKETILANYTARYGASDDALKYFEAATRAAPQEPACWQQLITYYLADGEVVQALAAADEASGKLTNHVEFDVLRNNAALIKGAADISGARFLLMSLGRDSSGDAPLLEALNDIVSAAKNHEPPGQTAAKLRQLADRNPRVLVLQATAIEMYIESGQSDEAINLATRAVQSFPTAVEPRRVETNLLGAAQRWDEALGAAKEWRQRDPNETLDPDLAIAGAELQLGDLTAANQQIQPYLDRAMTDPDRFSGVILLRARELLANHQPEKLEKFVGPLLAKSERLRSLWISLVVHNVDDSQRAQAWLQRVAAVTPQNPDEKLKLAVAWISIGKRWANPDYQLTGRNLLRSLAEAQDASTQAFLAWGSACEESADWTGAQKVYRRLLQREPANPIAMNNLASVLVQSRGNLEEAQQLADKALSLYPKIPNFLDTKAMVQAARKDFSGAIVSLKEAQWLDPQNFKWHVNVLADLIDSGQTMAAKAEMQQIKSSLTTFANVTPEARQRYDSLCAQLQ